MSARTQGAPGRRLPFAVRHPWRGLRLRRWSRQSCRDMKLRAALPRRPGLRPVPPVAAPEGAAPATPLAGAAPPDITRGDLPVIRAGGMLLPDRPRETPDPRPFRVPRYYLEWERGQAAGRWLP